MKKILSIVLVGILCVGLCGCSTDTVDQITNVVQSENENVLLVKNGTNDNYPDVTYGDAFEEYFKTPTWKYFKGTQEGPDDVTSEDNTYPSEMKLYKGKLDPMDVAGEYGGDYGQSMASVSIYSSPEGKTIGNATIGLDSEIKNYSETEYSGELTKLNDNVYSLENNDNQSILLAMNYDEENDIICFEFWIDNEHVENFCMLEHYQS